MSDQAPIELFADGPRRVRGHITTTVRIKVDGAVDDVRLVRLDDPPVIEAYALWVESHYNGRSPGREAVRRKLLALLAGDPTTGEDAAGDATGEGATEESAAPDTRPWVEVSSGDLHRSTQRLWATVADANTPPTLFLYGGLPARVEQADAETPAVHDLDVNSLRYEVAARVRCYRPQESGKQDVPPPPHLVQNMKSTPRPPLPVLRRVVEVPIVATNGALVHQPGYHRASQVFYAPAPGLVIPPVPAAPSADDIARARRLLLDDLLGDFPFVEEADRAHAVAALLEQFVRELIDGPMPLHDIEAPSPGCGKGLLADVLGIPFVGRHVAITTQPRSDEEWRKKLTSLFRVATSVILIDNVSGMLTSGALAGALTAMWWEDRLLGQNATIKAPVRCTWLMTANNPILNTDMARRIVRSRLDPKVERPWTRPTSDFGHPNLREWAHAHRGALIWAALVLAQAWLAAGRPPGKTTIGSYEAWSRVLGGILGVAGIRGFLGNIFTLYERADADGATWRTLVLKWWDEYQAGEVTTKMLFELAQAIDSFDFGRATTERGQKTAFGMALSGKEDSIIVGYQIVRSGEDHNAQVWKLVPAEGPPARRRSAEDADDGPSAPDIPAPAGEPPTNLPNLTNLFDPMASEEIYSGADGDDSDSVIADSNVPNDSTNNILGAAQGEKVSKVSKVSLPAWEGDADRACWLASADDVTRALPDLLAASLLGLDTETTGLGPLTDELRLIQLATPERVYLLDAFRTDARTLVPLFAAADGPVLAGHNLGFDLRFLHQAGLPIPTGTRLFDTMLAAQLLGAGTPEGRLHECGLAKVAARYLGVTLDKQHQVSDWAGTLTTEQMQYAARDAAILPPLVERLRSELQAAELGRVAALEMRALPAIAWLELTGAPFDSAGWRALSDGALIEQLRLEQELTALAGETDMFGHGTVNWGSPAQVAGLLRRRGHTVENTDEATLFRLAAEGEPLARLLLDYREASRKAGAFGIEFLRHVHPRTSRIHASYLQLGSRAGRMSCQHPNLQQVPRDRAYRACFRPAPGRVLVKADYAQIELRLAAEIAGDAALVAAFQRGEDLHALTARQVLGKQDVTKEDRQAAKAVNFGLLYGMGALGLRQYAAQQYGVRWSEQEAAEARERFFAAYKGLRAWQQHRGKALSTETRTVLGRRRQNVTAFTEKLNSPVQGSGADGLKAALALLWETRARVPSAAPVLVVHDEIVLECAHNEAEQARAWLVECMQRGMSAVMEHVPVEVEASIRKDWSGTPVEPAGGAV